MKILHDLVAIAPDAKETVSKGGIVIPEGAAEKPSFGLIVGVGPGGRAMDGTLLPTTVKEGDHVMYGRYAGNDFVMNGQKVIVMQEASVLAILSRQSSTLGPDGRPMRIDA